MSHSPAEIRREAARLLKMAGVSREPVSLRDVISALNLEAVRSTGEPFLCDAALQPRGAGRRLVLEGPSGERRWRFIIAHEIGHFVLHPLRRRARRPAGLSPAEWQEQEHEADQFAADLLMPEDRVREAVLEYGGDPARLADRFEVSSQAMQGRLRALGLAGQHAAHSAVRPY